MNKRIVFGAHFHWHSYLHIGSHQYAKQFAENGFRVAYISEPISPLHYTLAKERGILREKFYSWRKGGEWVEEGKIWTYVPFTLLPAQNRALLRSRFIINHSHRLMVPSINSMLRKNDFDEADIVFLDDAFDYLLDMVDHKKSILRIHDDISFLHGKGFENFLEKEKEVIQKVDLVIAVSRPLEKMAREMGAKKVLFLPNGADFKCFFFDNEELPVEYKNIPSPRVIYVGSIKEWLDVDLIAYMACKLPTISFIFIGKPMIDIRRIASLPNVYFLGERGHATLPKYLRGADVAIIPFYKTHSVIKVMSHPIQLFEYMSCGLPVVSTRWRELESLRSPAHLAATYEEFVELINKALSEKERGKYIEFAKANSWEERFEKLMKTLYTE